MMCVQTVSTRERDAGPLDCFMWVTRGALGRSGGERTFFMQAVKERKKKPHNALEMGLVVSQEITAQLCTAQLCGTRR